MSWVKPPPRTKQYEAGPITPRAPALRVADTRARLCLPLPKNSPLRSGKYRQWIATLACAHCNRHPPSQCAHADEGKGMAMKSSDETCFPLCITCHAGIGSEGWFTREQRRTLEKTYGPKTAAAAVLAGKWPEEWPLPGSTPSQETK